MYRKILPYFFILANIMLSSCGISIQSNNTQTPPPAIITVTLPPSVTPHASETLLPTLLPPTIHPIVGRTSTQVNVRAEPSTVSETLGVIPANSQVQIIGKDTGNNWWQIIYPAGTDKKGWVTAQYVETESRPEVPVIGGANANPNGHAGIIIQQLNIRSGPGTGFNSIGILNANDVIDLSGKNRDGAWLQIEFAAGPDGKGWVNAGFVKTDAMDALPIVSELGDVIGTSTPINTSLPPAPTLVPAPMDFDSADTPLRTVTFTSTGVTSLVYNGDVSTPAGDSDDWIAFIPYTDVVYAHLQCSGEATLLVEFIGTTTTISCNAPFQPIRVSAGVLIVAHIQIIPSADELQYIKYIFSITSDP